jgi:hypothetical protein
MSKSDRVILMENINELKREAEEAKERLKRDIVEVTEILGKIAEEAGEMGKARAVEVIHQVEHRIEDTLQRVEKRIDKAIAMATESSANAGGIVTREIDLTDFTNVEVGHAFKVDITRSDSYSISIAASEALIDHVDVTRSGNTLKISLKPLRCDVRPALQARIAMPVLHKLRLAGATRGKVSGFNSQESFNLNLSGGSTLDVDIETGDARFEISGASKLCGSMKTADAEFVLSGASRAELSGSANNVVLSAWGASKLDLADFALNDTSVHLKGASQAAVNVRGRLDLDLSGCSRLKYTGNPTIREVTCSGASTLSQR